MVAVRSPSEAGEVVAYVFAMEKAWAVGKNDVVFGKTFFCGGWGRD